MLSEIQQEWVERKSGGVVSLRLAWARAVAQAGETGIEDSVIERFLESFEFPASVIKLVECVHADKSFSPSELAKALESSNRESSFNESEWLAALERMLQFLIRESRSAAISVTLGYLSCSAEYLEASGSTLPFKDGVDAFLAEFGFEG